MVERKGGREKLHLTRENTIIVLRAHRNLLLDRNRREKIGKIILKENQWKPGNSLDVGGQKRGVGMPRVPCQSDSYDAMNRNF